MGFSLTSKLGIRKGAKKLLGRNSRFFRWGYTKKKLGLNRIFGSPVNSASSSMQGSHYGVTGSIVGKY